MAEELTGFHKLADLEVLRTLPETTCGEVFRKDPGNNF